MKTIFVVPYRAKIGRGLLALCMAAHVGFVSAEEILIRELDKAVDRKLLQTDPKQVNRWRAMPYESEEFAGVMLGEGGGTKQQPITIQLKTKGVYRIYLGLYGGFDAQQLHVRLSSDPSSEKIPIQVTGDRTTQKKKDFYPLVVTDDGNAIFRRKTSSTPEGLLQSFDAIPDGTCMRMLLWGNGCADNCNYPTNVGQLYPMAGLQIKNQSTLATNLENFGNLAANLGIWKEKAWDSLKIVRDYARQRKWEFQVYIRMEAFKSPFPFDCMENSKFFNDHPQYHCLDRNGQRVVRLSYAYPEVQQYMLRLIQEIADYEPDGICLCFIRGVPLVLYEPIMIEGFKKQYGIDPRVLKELDP